MTEEMLKFIIGTGAADPFLFAIIAFALAKNFARQEWGSESGNWLRIGIARLFVFFGAFMLYECYSVLRHINENKRSPEQASVKEIKVESVPSVSHISKGIN